MDRYSSASIKMTFFDIVSNVPPNINDRCESTCIGMKTTQNETILDSTVVGVFAIGGGKVDGRMKNEVGLKLQ